MFLGIVFQAADLKWFVPEIVGSIALLGVVALLFRVREWPVVVIGALAVALIGAGVFTTFSLTKEGVTIETVQQSTEALDGLKSAAQQNSDSIAALTTKLNELTSVVQKISATEPATATHTDDLKKITDGTMTIQGQIKKNDLVLQNVTKNIDNLNKLNVIK